MKNIFFFFALLSVFVIGLAMGAAIDKPTQVNYANGQVMRG